MLTFDPARIDDHEVAQIARQLIAARSPNPPGSVTAAATVVTDYLEAHGLEYRLFRPASDRLNIVCSVHGEKAGPHIVLSGHLDTFPEHPQQQTAAHAPSALEERVYGRGASDMKGGVAGFIVLLRHFATSPESWGGKLTMVLVCDEETFGPHGIRTLETEPGVFDADAVLSAEPSGRGMVRYGERGPVWGAVEFSGTAGHGAYVSAGEVNVILRASDFVTELNDRFAEDFSTPDEVVRSPLPGGEQLSLNIGLIQGGSKVNTKPAQCSVEIDIRVPPGIPAKRIVEWMTSIAAEHGGEYRPFLVGDANLSNPDEALFQALAEAVLQETRLTAKFEIALGSTDARHWRERGIPAAQYGADPRSQATVDESVPVKELGEIARIHARTAFALMSKEPR